ncbi:hypothetical protein [Nocardioides sp. GY 10113]|nr:hypothetical protein [Nocardioides sp. GY 10113]
MLLLVLFAAGGGAELEGLLVPIGASMFVLAAGGLVLPERSPNVDR